MNSPVPAWPPGHPGPFHVDADASWGQGRALFGGLVAEACLRAMATVVPAGRTLRSMTATLPAPVAPGRFEVHPTLLRSGSAITFTACELRQDGQVCAVVQAAWGADRPTRLRVDPPGAPPMPPPDSRPVFPFLPGVTPNFTQHYDYRWTVDRLPFSGADRAHIQGWVRPRADAPVDDATLAALVDAWPSPVLSLADRPVPASTVTWHLNLVAPVGEAPADAWWAWDATVSASDHGYADMEGRLYDAHGRLVAVSRQLMVEFSGRG